MNYCSILLLAIFRRKVELTNYLMMISMVCSPTRLVENSQVKVPSGLILIWVGQRFPFGPVGKKCRKYEQCDRKKKKKKKMA